MPWRSATEIDRASLSPSARSTCIRRTFTLFARSGEPTCSPRSRNVPMADRSPAIGNLYPPNAYQTGRSRRSAYHEAHEEHEAHEAHEEHEAHEAHEEHEVIRERSVRCHLVVPARGASEPRSHNPSFDSVVRRIPSSCSSCPSWLLQRSPGGNALSGERLHAPSRRR